MSGNDGRCVLNKAFCVHTAQTVLSNGIFSEENPASPSAFTVSSTANKMPDYLGGGGLIAVADAAKLQFPLLITKRKHFCLMLKIVVLLVAVALSHSWYFIIIR